MTSRNQVLQEAKDALSKLISPENSDWDSAYWDRAVNLCIFTINAMQQKSSAPDHLDSDGTPKITDGFVTIPVEEHARLLRTAQADAFEDSKPELSVSALQRLALVFGINASGYGLENFATCIRLGIDRDALGKKLKEYYK